MAAKSKQNYLSIEDLAQRTALEESLIRYYESEFADQLPEKILRGNTLFFSESAVDALLEIHRRMNQGSEPDSSHSSEHPNEKRYARVIAVTSGKGGVGKTNLALNLSILLQQQGKTVVLLDADLGMANVHLLAGIFPEKDLGDYVRQEAPLSDCITIGPGGIGIVPGVSGVVGLVDNTPSDRRKMLDALEKIEAKADCVVVDTGAGMGEGVRQFLRTADEVLFVLTPDITSLADAYSLLKALHTEGYDGKVYSVVNMVGSLDEAATVAARFADCADKFLRCHIENIGYLLKDATVGAATVNRTPYCLFNAEARISANTRSLAAVLLQKEDASIRLSSAFARFKNLLNEKLPASGGA